MNNKKGCSKKGGSKVNKKPQVHKCVYCDKVYKRKDTLTRHRKNCKSNKNNINGTNNHDNTLIAGDNNTINNIYVNLIIVPHGKDGIKDLELKDIKNILKSDSHPIENMILKVNFDPDKPQHHNVYYSDIKSAYGEVYEDQKWTKKKN